MISNPKIIISGVLTGMDYSVKILVPSLFPLMFLSRFIINSQILDFSKKYFNILTKFLFYLPGSVFPAIILSMLGGYPIGAICAQKLLETKEINLEQFNRLLRFTVNSGPGFIINFLGLSILKNQVLANIILISQVISSLTIAIISGIISRIKHEKFYCNYNILNKSTRNLSEIFVETISETSINIINICFTVIIFNSLISVLIFLNIFKNMNNEILFLIQSFLEITCGICFLKNNIISPEIISFAVNYAGLSTHFQIISILKNTDFNYANFHIFRIISAIISVVITVFLTNYFGYYIPTFITNTNNIIVTHGYNLSIYGSIALCIMCVYYTVSICKNNNTRRK